MTFGFGSDETIIITLTVPSKAYSYEGIMFAQVTKPKSASASDAPDLWASWGSWQKKFIIKLPKGFLVKDTEKHAAFSEGSGYGLVVSTNIYGLVIAATLSERDPDSTSQIFESLFKGIETYAKNKNGLYAWKLSSAGKQLADISATDADIDVAYSLINMQQQVLQGKVKPAKGQSKYAKEPRIQELIDSIWDHEVIKRGGRLILKPSDGSWPEWGDGRFVFNPSYFLPHQLRAIAKFDKNKQHDWAKVINDSYDLMTQILADSKTLKPKGQNPIPDQVLCQVANNSFACESYNNVTPDNEFDAIRVPLQIGRAAIYDNDPKAKDFLKAFLAKAGVTGFWTANIGAGQNPANKFGWNNELAMAMYGVAVKGVGGEFSQQYLAGYKKQLLVTFHKDYFGYVPQDANQYYKQTLVLQAALIIFN